MVGQIISGKIGNIIVRQKSKERLEIGDLLYVEGDGTYFDILQVYDLGYGSQISSSSLELLSGMTLEGYGAGLDFLEPELRNYVLLSVKSIARILKDEKNYEIKIPKMLPNFFNSVRYITKEDLVFLDAPSNFVYLGKIRSGTDILDVEVKLNSEDVFKHHILIPASTGRGKSNLVKVMLWSILNQNTIGALILDPHNEYYGCHTKGLKDHPEAKDNLVYYSSNTKKLPPGAISLLINLRSIQPSHFQGIVTFTDAQNDAIRLYYNQYNENWIENIIRGTEVRGIHPRTLEVLQRKFNTVLGVYQDNSGNIVCRSRVFSSTTSGESTTKDIIENLENGKKIIIDTSLLVSEAELLIGSIITNGIFYKYQYFKSEGELEQKPVITVVIEEAPRILSGETIATKGDNIYSIITREGRKFRIGIMAITQLTSLIPRQILANINTKIILGNELALERKAIINSAAQDLSQDDRAIASLDRGEAIVSSIFAKFAIPIYIPKFEDYIKDKPTEEKEKKVFTG
ncbi:MAG: ATP-binding protein [Candidatus Heimdallarchaeota archaeon]|nr:ATP-binding protein [Candidatus Heimdallarchaeota archaeon]